MKKILLLISCVFISINMQAQDVDAISLNYDAIVLNVGEDTTLVVNFDPVTATNKSVTWSIEDNEIADIDTMTVAGEKICVVIGLTVGETVLTVKSASGSYIATCTIKVVEPVVGMALSEQTMNITIKDSILIARINPSDASNDSIRWVSRDSSIVTIKSTAGNRYDTICHISAVRPGTAWIVAETVDGNFKDSCIVTVTSAPIESFTLDYDTLNVIVGSDITITAQIRPLEETYKRVSWTNSNFPTEDIIEITSSGYDTICVIKAKGAGRAYIVAESHDGQKDTCVVNVRALADKVELDNNAITLDLKDDTTGLLIASVFPEAAVITTELIWSTSSGAIVQIDSIVDDSLCYIKALSAGTAVIYVVTDNDKKDSCIVTVSPRLIDSLIIDKSSFDGDTLVMDAYDLFELSVEIYPSNATNDSLIYESSDPEVATVDTISNSTFINALKGGEVIIYVRANDGGDAYDSCIVRINDAPIVPVEGMSLDRDTILISNQGFGTVIAELLPANATNDSIEWSVSDNTIIEIEASTEWGLIATFKGLKADTAYIYAKTKDGEFKDSCVVIVQEQYIFISADTVNVDDGLIELSVMIPDGVFDGSSFKLQLPEGFGLTKKDVGGFKTSLTDEVALYVDLSIEYVNDSTYIFNISPKAASMFIVGAQTKVLDIYYTIYDDALVGNNDVYEAKFGDITIKSGDDVINEEHTVKIKVFRDATGNEAFKTSESFAYFVGGRLYVNSDKVETVYVYSLTGSLIYTKEKAEGLAVFDINTQEKILIVRGGSGWTSKVIN